jgi:hypothetical protein
MNTTFLFDKLHPEIALFEFDDLTLAAQRHSIALLFLLKSYSKVSMTPIFSSAIIDGLQHYIPQVLPLPSHRVIRLLDHFKVRFPNVNKFPGMIVHWNIASSRVTDVVYVAL